MFVEIARLLIVLLATGAGYAIARASASDGSATVVLGAVLGALLCYVIGGVIARLVRRGMGRVEATVDEVLFTLFDRDARREVSASAD